MLNSLNWRLSLLSSIIALGAATSGCDSGPPPANVFLVNELQPTAGQRCVEAFASGATGGTTAPGSVPGQAAALAWNDDSHLEERFRPNKNAAPKFDWLHPGDILPSLTQAQTTDAVHTLVCIHATHVPVGNYGSSGNVGVRVDWDLRVLRWPSGEVIAARAFTGHAPDDIGEFKQGDSNVALRGRTSSEAYAWMKELIAR